MAEKNKVEELTTQLAETVCDTICRHSHNKELTEEHLEEICTECPMGEYIIGICNTYNELNTLKGSQLEKALQRAQAAEEKLAQQ